MTKLEPATTAPAADRRSIDAAVRRLGDLVVVWAHPDDESYLAAGLVAAAVDLGARVTCVTATPGDLAPTAAERAAVRRNREAELTAALSALGVVDRVLLGHPDGGCAGLDPELPIAEIAAVIGTRAPDTVVTFGADGVTGHADHRAVHRWTTEAVRRARPGARVLHPAVTAERLAADADIDARFDIYEPGTPRVHPRRELAVELALDEALLDTKVRALRAHASQTTGLIAALGSRRFRDWVSVEAFVDAPTGRGTPVAPTATRPSPAPPQPASTQPRSTQP